jgi:hypothetical protein
MVDSGIFLNLRSEDPINLGKHIEHIGIIFNASHDRVFVHLKFFDSSCSDHIGKEAVRLENLSSLSNHHLVLLSSQPHLSSLHSPIHSNGGRPSGQSAPEFKHQDRHRSGYPEWCLYFPAGQPKAKPGARANSSPWLSA